MMWVVGEVEWEKVGFEGKGVDGMGEIGVGMICFGGSKYKICLVMGECDKKEGLEWVRDGVLKE